MYTTDYKFAGLIAPCGMNCGICIGYLREKTPCAGCRSVSTIKSVHCSKCVIANCEHLSKTSSGFCSDCDIYPCDRLKRLDKRYRANYGMSMIYNLDKIHSDGIESFLIIEDDRWNCRNCGAILSVHRKECLECKTIR